MCKDNNKYNKSYDASSDNNIAISDIKKKKRKSAIIIIRVFN